MPVIVVMQSFDVFCLSLYMRFFSAPSVIFSLFFVQIVFGVDGVPHQPGGILPITLGRFLRPPRRHQGLQQPVAYTFLELGALCHLPDALPFQDLAPGQKFCDAQEFQAGLDRIVLS